MKITNIFIKLVIVLLAIYSGELQWILKDNLISYDNDEVYERNETVNAMFLLVCIDKKARTILCVNVSILQIIDYLDSLTYSVSIVACDGKCI